MLSDPGSYVQSDAHIYHAFLKKELYCNVIHVNLVLFAYYYYKHPQLLPQNLYFLMKYIISSMYKEDSVKIL